MARVVILGGGIAGHTAALHLTRMLGRLDEVVVVTPNANWNWIPSNIWVGVGKMQTEQVTFALAPIYKRMGIEHHQALATAIHPEGDGLGMRARVDVTYMLGGPGSKYPNSGVFARGDMALNANLNQIVVYLGPAPLPVRRAPVGPLRKRKTGLGYY